MNDSIVLVCVFCGKAVVCITDEEFDAAMDAGWTPSLRIGENSIDATHCGECAVQHTISTTGGEPELIEGHEQFLWGPLQ